MRRQEAQSTRKTSLGSLDPIEKAVVAKFRANLSDHIADSTKHITWGIPLPYGAKLWHFDGSLVSTDGISPESGAVATLRPNEGRFGGAVAVEEGTTNLVYDSGTIFRGTHISPDELPAPPPVTPVFCYTWTDLRWNGDIELAKTFQAGDVVTISGWIYESGPWAILDVYGTENGTSRSFGRAFEPTGQTGWHYFEKTVVFQGETTIFRIEDGGWDYYNPDREDESQIWLVNVQMEEKPYPTSFVNGTRAAGWLSYPQLLDKKRGTLSVWINPHVVADYNNFFPMSLSTGRFLLFFGANGVSAWDFGPVNSGPSAPAGTIVAGQWTMHTLTWDADAGVYRYYVNGEFVGERQYVEPDSLPSVLPTVTNYGALLDELLVAPFAATPEQIQAWYAMGAPFWDPWVGQR